MVRIQYQLLKDNEPIALGSMMHCLDVFYWKIYYGYNHLEYDIVPFSKDEEVYRKAKAFDNYMVDLAKTIELYPHDYIKNNNFAKETYEFYMKSKEDFIKAYENEVGRKYELIRDVAEYDRILSDLEDE